MDHCGEEKKERIQTVKIGIIGAMDVEVARLTAGMNKEREIERAGMHFCEGWIG